MKLQTMVAVMFLGAVSVQAQKPEADMLRDAQRLYDSGKFADAERGFAEITREHPENIAAQMYLGQTLFKEEKFAAAVGPHCPSRGVPL